MKNVCQISGKDGNAFAIMSRVSKALKEKGVIEETIKNYKRNAMLKDYNHLVRESIKVLEKNGIKYK